MTYFYAITHNFLSTRHGKIGHASVCRFTDERQMRRFVAQKLARSFDTRECTEAEAQQVIDAKIEAQETFTEALVEFAGGQLTEEDVFWMLAKQYERVVGLVHRLVA